jgi:hypothetical protein
MPADVRREIIMRVLRPLLVLSGLFVTLAGCDQQAAFEKFIPREESALAKQVLAHLAAKDYGAIEKQLDPSVITPSVHAALEQMAAMFPPEQAKRVTTVGANTMAVDQITTYNLTFEHEFSQAWLLSNVLLRKRGTHVTVLGLHVSPMTQSLEAQNRFTFAGKGVLHHVVFALAMTIPIFIVFTLVLCARTRIARRKWLWLIFVALGVVQLSLSWTDGSYAVQPLRVVLLGSGFVRSGPYAPVIFNISFPLGAVVFLVKRRSLGSPLLRATESSGSV